MYAMLTNYGSRMRADDEVVCADLQEYVKSFGSALERATIFTQDNHKKHATRLSSDAAVVLEAAQDLSVECMSASFDDATADPAEMRKRLAEMEQKVFHCSFFHGLPMPWLHLQHVHLVGGRITACSGVETVCSDRIDSCIIWC
jgi:hypothetical protein